MAKLGIEPEVYDENMLVNGKPRGKNLMRLLLTNESKEVHRVKVKYIGPTCVSLINGKEYDVLAIEKTCYRIIDETEEDYLFMPEEFEIVEE